MDMDTVTPCKRDDLDELFLWRNNDGVFCTWCTFENTLKCGIRTSQRGCSHDITVVSEAQENMAKTVNSSGVINWTTRLRPFL